MEKDYISDMIVNASKAGAYDVVSKQRNELMQQNKNLKAAINSVLDELQKSDPHEVVNNPAALINRISAVCLNALRNNI